jgi:hypothetical protein
VYRHVVPGVGFGQLYPDRSVVLDCGGRRRGQLDGLAGRLGGGRGAAAVRPGLGAVPAAALCLRAEIMAVCRGGRRRRAATPPALVAPAGAAAVGDGVAGQRIGPALYRTGRCAARVDGRHRRAGGCARDPGRRGAIAASGARLGDPGRGTGLPGQRECPGGPRVRGGLGQPANAAARPAPHRQSWHRRPRPCRRQIDARRKGQNAARAPARW